MADLVLSTKPEDVEQRRAWICHSCKSCQNISAEECPVRTNESFLAWEAEHGILHEEGSYESQSNSFKERPEES